MDPGLSNLASGYQDTTSPTVSFVSVDGKKLTEIAKRCGVSKAPCVVFLRDDKVLEPVAGFDLDKIREALNRHAGIPDVTGPAVPAEILERRKDALNARLTELVRIARVVLFMKGTPESPRCRFSRRLAGILREHDIDFDSFDVLADEEVRQGLKEYADWPTYPQLWVDSKLLGGLDIVSSPVSFDSARVFLTCCFRSARSWMLILSF